MTDIQPALTAEEWEKRDKSLGRAFVCVGLSGRILVADDCCYETVSCEPELQHALAALALHGQVFGFTREDAQLVLDCIGMEWDRGERDECKQLEARLQSLAARIAALLPPEPNA